MKKFEASDDPAAAVGEAVAEAVAEFASKVRHFDPIRLIEVARLAFLPLAPTGSMPITPESSAAPLELLALIALAPAQGATVLTPSSHAPVEEQEMSHFVSTAREEIDKLFHLTQLRSFAAADATDKLALVSLLVQGGEVWKRNSSYPEMVKTTNHALLDGHSDVQAALVAELGFDASDALAVLGACHDLQVASMNHRIDAMRGSMFEAMASTEVFSAT